MPDPESGEELESVSRGDDNPIAHLAHCIKMLGGNPEDQAAGSMSWMGLNGNTDIPGCNSIRIVVW